MGREGWARVEQGTYLYWKIMCLWSKIQTSYINDTHSIHHKNILAFGMPLKSFHQSGAASRPYAHVVLPRWSLPRSPPLALAAQRRRRRRRTSRRRHQPRQGAAAAPRTRRAAQPFCRFSWITVLFPALSKGEIAIMHIQNELKPNMTRQLWICTNWWIRRFSTSPLSSVNWEVKLISPLWNCNIQIRGVKADSGWSLIIISMCILVTVLIRDAKGPWVLFPFLLILSHFIQITEYDFIHFSCFKHWNLNAVRIRPPPILTAKATPTHTDTCNFFCVPVLAMLQLSLCDFKQGLMRCSSMSWEEQKVWRKRINKTGWPLCHCIHFSGSSPKEKLLGSCISRDSQWGFLPRSRGRASKSTHNWFSGSSKSSRSRKKPDYNIFKTQ